MSAPSVTSAIEHLLSSLSPGSKVDDQERKALLKACSRLHHALESPFEAASRLIFAPHLTTAVRVCIDMGVFDALSKANKPLSAADLAVETNADPILVVRWLRVLSEGGIIEEKMPGQYAALQLATMLTASSPFAAAFKHFEIDAEVVSKLPAWFHANGYTNPSDAYDGPFQFTIGSKEHYFDWVARRPAEQAAFNAVMQLNDRNRGPDWFDLYPVAERLPRALDADTALLVDVGGGVGQDLRAFAARFPNLLGRLVLQDIPSVISAVPTDPPLPLRIEAVAHDFFQPQPVLGACAYYLRTVLHDWPDRQAEVILRNVAAAMNSSSRLLVSEKVMPETNPPNSLVYADISMMVQFAALERTRGQWLALIEAAGFEVIKVWEPGQATEGARTLFEARLK